MTNPTDFKQAKQVFDELAVDGYIGCPNGTVAYAYIRVSSEEQADDNRSGLARQIACCHEVATKEGYRISWSLVFADDDSGFEFEEREALCELRQEFKRNGRRANVLVMESLDRLSRNADWHQGYLLDEMKRYGVTPVFWKRFSSRVERAVMGAVAQDGMEESKRRMMEGNLHKARTGRVTARTPSYGYKLVDSDGNEGLAAKRDTHYAIYDDEEWVVRLMYQRVINGDTMRGIADYLAEAGVPPPKNYKHWEPTQIRLIIKNTVYRGDFYAHRWEEKKVQKLSKDGYTVRTVKCKVERPSEEWIHVPVPAIVSREDWEAANRMLEQNRKMSRRNAKTPFLLTGLLRCDVCGYTYCGTTSRYAHGKLREKPSRSYRCVNSNCRPRHIIEAVGCDNRQIVCSIVDDAVWGIVCDALLQPNVLIDALDTDATGERNTQLLEQINFLEREIAGKGDEDEKLYRAYNVGAFDEHEFAARRRKLKEESAKIAEELKRLCSQVVTPEQLEERKAEILAFAAQVQALEIPVDPPFEVKQRIIKMVVDEIVLNVRDGWLRVEGAIRGTFSIESIPSNVVFMEIRLKRVPVPRR